MQCDFSVGVVIPTKNRLDVLGSAVESALNQDYPIAEIIIVDDSDKGQDVERIVSMVSGYNSAIIRVVMNNRRPGGAAARNCGIISSRADYIAFLDDDDTWEREKIRLQINLLKSNPNAVVFCGYYDDDRIFGRKVVVLPRRESIKIEDLLAGECPTSTTLAVAPRSVLIDVGMFDEDLGGLQDYDLWIRCAMVSDLISVNRPLATFIQHAGERVSMNVERRKKALEIVIAKLISQSLMSPRDANGFRSQILGSLFLGVAKRSSVTSSFATVSAAIKAVYWNPKSAKAWKWLLAGGLVKPFRLVRSFSGIDK